MSPVISYQRVIRTSGWLPPSRHKLEKSSYREPQLNHNCRQNAETVSSGLVSRVRRSTLTIKLAQCKYAE